MLFTQIALAILTTSVLASPHVKRDYTTVQTDLTIVNANITIIKNDLSTYSGTGAESVKIFQDAINIERTLNKTTDDIKASGAATTQQCTNILNYVNNPIEPNAKAALANAKAKKQTFTNAGLLSAIRTVLNDLKTTSDRTLDAIYAACPANLKSSAQATKNKIDADFNDAISFYATP